MTEAFAGDALYTLTDLGTLGGGFIYVSGINKSIIQSGHLGTGSA